MDIVRIEHSKIDFEKYDACIENSKQGVVYAMSWYLNAVFENWSLLIADDYKIVMPLPLKKKFNISYALQPQFCQQLGLFSADEIGREQLSAFIGELPFFYNLNFNWQNAELMTDGVERPNYVLEMSSYENMAKAYSSQCFRNLKKAYNEDLKVVNIDSDRYLAFLKQNSSSWLNNSQLNILGKVIKSAFMHNCAEILAVERSTEIIAAVFFVNFKNRKYYLSPVSDEEGKRCNAMTFLLDSVLKRNADSRFILDFEGSAIEGVARFYKGFGAKNQPYRNVCNRLALNKILLKK